MKMPLVSVITPSYNQGKFIEQTIKSVISQDYPRVEYIVVDGKSTDETLSILKKYEPNLMWISEPDQGQSDAINKGWKMATGDILTWLNSDDSYAPGAITTAVQSFVNHPKVGLVYGDALLIDRDGRELGYHRSPKNGKRHLLWIGCLPQPSVFMRTSVINTVGGIDPNLNYSMDHDLFIRIVSKYPTIYIPKPLSLMRLYMGTKTTTNIQENWQEKLLVLKRYQRFWLISPIGFGYLKYKMWSMLPSSIQAFIRRHRGLIRDKIHLENFS